MAKKSPNSDAKKLRSYGLIPAYDFRSKLTKSQKANISRKTKQYEHLLKHPESFKVTTVSKETAKKIKRQGGDIKVIDNKVIIPLGRFSSAKIIKGKIIYDSVDRKEEVYLESAENILDLLEILGNKKVPNNQLVTARIGSSSGFLNSSFSTYRKLYLYITEFFGPEMDESKRDKLILQMSLVTVKEKK